MTSPRITVLLGSLLLTTPALAAEPPTPPESQPASPESPPAPQTDTPRADTQQAAAAPEYQLLYLAEATDKQGPQAIVRTQDVTPEGWMAIGRELRALRPDFPVMVAFFTSPNAPPIPDGYPDCDQQERALFERWTRGSYVYQARQFQFNPTGDVIETVKQNLIDPRERTLNGVDVIQLFAQDPTEIRNAPARQRIAAVSVVVPGLNQDDLARVAQAYEDEYGTPRLLQIIFFKEMPQWPDKPFITQGLFNHAGRGYVRSSRAANEARTEIAPLPPQWATLRDGEIVKE